MLALLVGSISWFISDFKIDFATITGKSHKTIPMKNGMKALTDICNIETCLP